MYFSELHVQTLSRAILQPGEQLLGQTVTSYMPFWAFGLIRRQHLVLATDQRLILVEHRWGLLGQRLHAIDSMPWSQVQEARVTGLFLKKKLRVRGSSERGAVALKALIPNAFFGLFAPMKNNMQGAKTVASTFQNASQGAALAAPQGSMAPQLGAPQSQYPQAQYPQAQQPQAQYPQAQGAPSGYPPPQPGMSQPPVPGTPQTGGFSMTG